MTPTSDFYRLLLTTYPAIARTQCALSVMDKDAKLRRLTMDDLRALPVAEMDATVYSTPNAGSEVLMATARWSGVWLRDVVPDVSGSLRVMAAHGRSATLPATLVDQGLLAYAMNSDPLPIEQGAPLRLIIPGLPDSALVAWVRRIEMLPETHLPTPNLSMTPVVTVLTAPVPKIGSPSLMQGYAFAGLEDISGMEIAVDGGTWSPLHWVRGKVGVWSRWKHLWTPYRTGVHRIEVRALASGTPGSVTFVVQVEANSP